MGMDQYLLIPFLEGWTSIYQLFWCSPGVQGFDTLPDGTLQKLSLGMMGMIFVMGNQRFEVPCWSSGLRTDEPAAKLNAEPSSPWFNKKHNYWCMFSCMSLLMSQGFGYIHMFIVCL